MEINLDAITRPTKDILQAVATLGDSEVRYLVDAYYQFQEYRKAAGNQIGSIDRATDEGPASHLTLDWMFAQVETMENQIKRALDVYTKSRPIGVWLQSHHGIGPVISAGLIAHIDIAKAPTVGHIWRFAGLDPTLKWEKGQKRPFNATLKTLCWKIGQSFMKFSGDERCVYGNVIYRQRKAYEIARNDAGGNAAAAAAGMARVGKATEAYGHYAAGKLPPAQIDARARRYAVKLFLSHMHEVWYEIHFGKKPPLPYPIAILGHAHKIEPQSAQ